MDICFCVSFYFQNVKVCLFIAGCYKHIRYYKTDIRGSKEGILEGKRIAIKDNIPVAGVPMMNGSSLLEGYTPEFDATVVTRILDNGNLSN